MQYTGVQSVVLASAAAPMGGQVILFNHNTSLRRNVDEVDDKTIGQFFQYIFILRPYMEGRQPALLEQPATLGSWYWGIDIVK